MVGKESGGESSEGLAGPAKRWDQKSLECGHLTDNVWLSRAVVLRPDCSGRRGGGRREQKRQKESSLFRKAVAYPWNPFAKLFLP